MMLKSRLLFPFFQRGHLSLCRLRLHEGKVIKDRRHHLRTYPNCFVAKELIDWLIDHKEASDRETAIKIMQKLLDQSIVHHGGPLGGNVTG